MEQRREAAAQQLRENELNQFSDSNVNQLEELITDFAEKAAALGCSTIIISTAIHTRDDKISAEGFLSGKGGEVGRLLSDIVNRCRDA